LSPAWDGTISSGFSALPGGMRYVYDGFFDHQTRQGNWWTSTPSFPLGTAALYRALYPG